MVEPTGSETQVFAKLGGEEVVAVFRERHKFEPGDKVRLKPDPALVHLFDEATRQATERVNACRPRIGTDDDLEQAGTRTGGKNIKATSQGRN